MRLKAGRSWPGWPGALVLLAVVNVPPVIAANDLVVTFGQASLGCGALLAALPGLALVALVAPLIGHRRRSALVALVPVWGWCRVAELGYDLAVLARSPMNPALATPEPASV